ncbi:hypothetical protein M0805_009251 [Coniferiporia weirii]|nr:hypothetical protein M0805_009251 [Coniferiporia weirii]
MSTSAPAALPEGELLELLVQLQKTTPESARAILNAQPAIGYALVPLMVRMGIVNLEVLQKTLSSYTASQTPAQPQAAPAVPPHVAQAQYQHQPTPPPASQTPNLAYPPAAAAPQYSTYQHPPQNGGQHAAYAQQYAQQYPAQAQPQYAAQQQQYQQHQRTAPSATPTPAPVANAPALLGALGNIPDDQREMIMRVIAMTPEQVNRLPPQDRAITIQLRATLGLPTE